MHFSIAARWPGTDPQTVLDSWDEATVDDALAIMAAEQRYRDAHKSE